MRGAGVILMGGAARRLGGISKADIVIGGVSCFDHAMRAVTGLDVIALSIADSAQNTPGTYPIIKDWPKTGQRGGPAFAILASLSWAKDQGLDFIITLPVDTPFLPNSYANTLRGAYNDFSHDATKGVMCANETGHHYLHALWPVATLPALKNLVLRDSIYKIGALHHGLSTQILDIELGKLDPFFNINSPQDLRRAQDFSNRVTP